MYFFIIFSILILFPAIGIFAFLVMNDKAKKEEKKKTPYQKNSKKESDLYLYGSEFH